MSTIQPTPPLEPKAPSKASKFAAKYGLFVIVFAIIGAGVAYRVYNDSTEEEEYYISQVVVASDGGAVLIKKMLRRKQRIELAHLQVPSSVSFQAKCYMEDTIAGREVKIKLLEGGGGVIFVPEGDLNYALVRYGLAKAVGQEYIKAEARAKKAKFGIWQGSTNLGES